MNNIWWTQLRTFIQANGEWLAISLTLGFLIWIVAALDNDPVQQREYSEAVTVEFIEDPTADVMRESTALLGSVRVRVVLRAPRSTWDSISVNDIRVRADLTNLPAGTHVVDLTGELVNEDLRGRVISIMPEQITVRLVDVGERLVQVTPETSAPPIEYVAGNAVCDPAQVRVRGPVSRINTVASAVTRLNISTIPEPTDMMTVNGSILLFDADNRLISSLSITPDTVVCQVSIQRREGFLVQVQPQIIGEPDVNYSLTGEVIINPASVFVTGDENAILALNGVITTEPIDIDRRAGTFTRSLEENDLILPPGVRLQQSSQQITVTVVMVENLDATTVSVPIRTKNLALGLDVVLRTTHVTVNITGPQSVVADLTSEDLSALVDLTGLGEGSHSAVAVEIELLQAALENAGLVIEYQPQAIDLRIVPVALPSPTPAPIFGKVGIAIK
jgi:YbbR domain-containing protein